MGCTQSKIENEEAVSRCKDRKQFMKDAVTTRNAFAAAHSAYSMALKNTGAALSDYSQGEVNELRPSLHHHHHLPHLHQPTAQPTYETLPPPPPPLPNFSPTPLKRAVTMPEFSIPKPDLKHSDTIQEEDDDDDDDDEIHQDENDNADHDLTHRRNRRGGSAGGGGGGGGGSGSGRTTEANTPQPPPSPPTPPKGMTWDYFFPMDIPGPSLSETDEIRPSDDNDESDGGGYHHHHHHNTNNRFQGSENVANGDGGHGNMNGVGGSSNSNVEEPRTPEKVIEQEEEEEEEEAKPMKKPKPPIAHSNTVPLDNRRGGKPGANVSFLQILNDLDDHFLKASESAHEVSKMLEATRLHYHSNFADNRGHIDHSERVMRVITWNRSFRGMPNADNGKDDFDSDEHETHATVLDKLLAWEKKLYDEVKAGELMKLEYQRKVALLNKQKKRGVHSEALEKTKAAVSHLHTRYIVDMQSMDSTVSEINRLRDKQLYPKLNALVDGMAQMWNSMHVHHDSQLKIVIDLRSVDVTQTPKETSEQHHERTVQLWGVVQEWHSQFQKLVNHQKEYVQALSNWLKLNLIPIESSLKEKVSSPPRIYQPAIQALLQAWHEHLEQLPDELAGNAIFSFAGIIKTIKLHQEEEMKLKEKCEETRKEFMRKNRAYEDWYHKYMQRRTPTDDMDPERSEDPNHKDPVAERQFLVETLKKRLDEEVEDHQKHCRQVREKSLANLKTHLPELFRAMSDFALACSHMYKNLQSISVPQNSNGTPA